ncbi:unnamed protein product [Gemmataceae bacterium]|nr:unnamed protein product [Gemmataceae bacterium]VTT99015.1 unnamed protein product [Gemmataceae bacterium]
MNTSLLITQMQDMVTELVAPGDWPDGHVRVFARPERVVVVGRGSAAAIVGVPGLRLARDLERAGLRVSFGPLLAAGGWVVACEVPGAAPDPEAAAVVGALLRKNRFATLPE